MLAIAPVKLIESENQKYKQPILMHEIRKSIFTAAIGFGVFKQAG